MKKIGIIGAMDVETELLLSKVEVLSKSKQAGFTYHECNYHGLALIITTCGIGKVNAASGTQIMINRYNPDAIINTGVAGGMKPEIQVCDVVISNEVTYYDVRKEQMKTCFPYKESFIPNEQLLNYAIKASADGSARYHIGKIASGDAFVTDPDLKKSIQLNFDPCCVDMESCPIAHVADINDVPFIVFRSISDNADEEATLSYEAFETKAANHSAEMVLKILEQMIPNETLA